MNLCCVNVNSLTYLWIKWRDLALAFCSIGDVPGKQRFLTGLVAQLPAGPLGTVHLLSAWKANICFILSWLHHHVKLFFLIRIVGGGVQAGSTRYVGHWMAYCIYPGWLWWWRNWWDEDWQEKPKYSEKTCPSATLSTTRDRTWAAALGSHRLTAWAVARPTMLNYTVSPISCRYVWCQHGVKILSWTAD
jgi:hypothetical protein